MRTIIVDIHIGPEQYLKNYRHPGAVVVSHSVEGVRVQFPANILQGFVSREGIRGRFRILFNDAGKFQTIERL